MALKAAIPPILALSVSDWNAIGNDLRQAMAQFRQDHAKQLTNA